MNESSWLIFVSKVSSTSDIQYKLIINRGNKSTIVWVVKLNVTFAMKSSNIKKLEENSKMGFHLMSSLKVSNPYSTLKLKRKVVTDFCSSFYCIKPKCCR
jgi:hypothetical protein